MNALPSDIRELIDEELANRACASRDELIIDEVRQMRLRKQQVDQLRHDIDQARSELHRGEGIEIANDSDLSAFFDDIRTRGQARCEAHGRSK